MKTEISVQLYENIDDLLTKLAMKNAKFVEQYQVIDYYFTKYSPIELKSKEYIEILDASFLVREIIEENSKSAKIVHKAKKLDEAGNVIAEDKTSVNIEDAKKAVALFKKSGLNCWCEMKNHSFVYSVDGIEFAIQEVEDLGTFIECEENNSIENLSDSEKFEFLKRFVYSLDFNIGNNFSVKKVYMKYLQDNKNALSH